MPVLNLVHLNLHVSDLDRSVAFYGLLGWKPMFPDGDMGEPHEMQPPIAVSPKNDYGGGVVRTAILTLGDDPRAATKLELIQYVDPPPAPRPRKPKNEVGVHRIAMRVKDIDGLVADLRAKGVHFPHDPIDIGLAELGSRQRFVLFPDPDENLLEFIELFR